MGPGHPAQAPACCNKKTRTNVVSIAATSLRHCSSIDGSALSSGGDERQTWNLLAAQALNGSQEQQTLSTSRVPIFLGLAAHRLAQLVLWLQPNLRRYAGIRRVDPLRNNAFEPHQTRVPEHGFAVVGEMVHEMDTGHRFAEEPEEFSCAVAQRQVAQVFALALDQMEREQNGGIVAGLTSQAVEV